MKVVGVTCGIGSMLLGARQAGFEVLGNVEWRKYYHAVDEEGRNTFSENFPGAFFRLGIDDLVDDELERITGIELAMGHPECGNFSNMSTVARSLGHDHRMDPSDIPLFVELIARLRPRFFVMDDLPKSLVPYPMKEYADLLPDYDLFPEWVSNHGYGNCQKNRKRFFMIGALREEGWSFAPNEIDNQLTVEEIIGDLVDQETSGEFTNHEPHIRDGNSALPIIDEKTGERRNATWAEAIEIVKQYPYGTNIPYMAADGNMKKKIGFGRSPWQGFARVLLGSSCATLHPVRCDPLTVRERARIQGFPDDFQFFDVRLREDGAWDHSRNVHLIKQTGKAMPIQFCRFVAQQIHAHIQGAEFETNNERIIRPNEHVDESKRWYCENIGYGNQERVCGNCWLYDRCETRSRKYQIGEPEDIGQPDAFEPGTVPVKKPKKKKAVTRAKNRSAAGGRFSERCPKTETMVFGGGDK